MRTLAILLILCACASAFGATYPASNASYVAVSNAVALASSGDTVTVPAGTAIWTNNLTIAKNLNLIGSNTVIVKYDTTVSHQIITWNPTGSTNQLSGFIFAGLNGPHQYDGAIYLNGSCNAFRVDHCMFSNLWNVPIWISGAIFGVIDHCTIQDVQFCNSLEIKNGNYGGGSYAYGDYSWASTPNYGTNYIGLSPQTSAGVIHDESIVAPPGWYKIDLACSYNTGKCYLTVWNADTLALVASISDPMVTNPAAYWTSLTINQAEFTPDNSSNKFTGFVMSTNVPASTPILQ